MIRICEVFGPSDVVLRHEGDDWFSLWCTQTFRRWHGQLLLPASVLVALSFSAFLVFVHLSAYKNPEVFLTSPLLLASVSSHSASMNSHMSVIFLSGAEVLNWGHLDGPLLFNRVLCVLGASIAVLIAVSYVIATRPLPCTALEDILLLAWIVICLICLEHIIAPFKVIWQAGSTIPTCIKWLHLLIIGGEERTIEFMEREGCSSAATPLLDHASERGVIHHHFPMNYLLKPWRVGMWFYQLIKFGIFQYMIIKTITAILSVILKLSVYTVKENSNWAADDVKRFLRIIVGFTLEVPVSLTISGLFLLSSAMTDQFSCILSPWMFLGGGFETQYPYMAAVLNFSQYWALYCLVQFYTAIKDELAHTKPLAKFLMFKSIVFLTWWQGVTIALLYTFGLLKSPIAQGLQFKSSIQDFFICIELQDSSKLKVLTDSLVLPAQMAVASVAHLYVFPAKPYELLADQSPGNVSVLGDYASVDCPVDPDEVRDSTRPTKLRLPQPDVSVKSVTDIRESVRDIVVGGGEHIVNDFKFTVTQAVEPVEKSFTRLNEKLHRISENIKKHDKDRRKARDDSCITSPMRRAVRGIDDPLLNGTTSDGGVSRGRQRSRKSGCTSESGGESSNQGRGEYETHGCRWVIRD
ncbi:hypothetical protein MUK42_18201 [Musa troglodytarum]|uniref:Uncharacterized protein n=1 Tax=Musa troglodytarum TaxID=320322 RepID=A0A9E7KVG0_9LILI|nr:hypothetical protein MUK42_18201 [Musa troglodytarum]